MIENSSKSLVYCFLAKKIIGLFETYSNNFSKNNDKLVSFNEFEIIL